MCATDRFQLEFKLNFLRGVQFGPVDRWNFPKREREIIRKTPDGQLVVSMARWGLIPPNSPDGTTKLNTYNARDDSLLMERSLFLRPFEKRRCLLIGTSFIEQGDRYEKRVPIEVVPQRGAPYCYAGLWERWGEGDAKFESCTMITTEPNEVIAPFHSRMPVLLTKEEGEFWLDRNASRADLLSLLRPAPSDDMIVRDAELPPRKSASQVYVGETLF